MKEVDSERLTRRRDHTRTHGHIGRESEREDLGSELVGLRVERGGP